jgi:hypothetical protein
MLVRARSILALIPLAAAGVAVCQAADASDAPLVLMRSVEAGGAVLGNMGPAGVEIRFIEHGQFFLGALLSNGSGQALTVVDAQTPEPPGSLVRQTGTRLVAYKPCPARVPCSLLGRDLPDRLNSVTVAPGDDVAVKLKYQLSSCSDARVGSLATAEALVVTYRASDETLHHQTFPIGRLQLFLQRPAGVECVPRPYSHIGLVGSFTTSPGHKPVPGSDGDTCTRTSAGGLRFRSRLFTDRSGVQFRVAIELPRFLGEGVYGAADVVVSGGFGDRGQTTFHGHPARVTVTQAAAPVYGGRFEATLSGRRRFFRAYGAWRCTTKLG